MVGYQNTKEAAAPAFARAAAAVSGAIAVLGAAGIAHAFDINAGSPDLTIRWDNTVRYNLSGRAEGKDPRIANSPTTDESDNKFDRGDIVNNRVDLLSEFDFMYKGITGFRVSGAGWYDAGYDDTTVKTAPGLENRASYNGNSYSSFTKRFYRGPSGELLDAFVFGNFDAGQVPIRIRAGKHSVFWGESIFNANHAVAYSQMPSDSRKSLSSPGVEAKETLLPLTQISGQVQLADDLSINGQYFFDWKPNRLPEGGTYYGAADFLFEGPDRFSVAPGLFLRHAQAVEPSKRGDWGLNARWSPSWLDGTLGFYYRKFDERQPWSSPQIDVANRFYRLVYAKDTELFGVSLGKRIGPFATGAEIVRRKNTAFVNTGINANTLEGPRGDSTHAVLNATLLTSLSQSNTLTLVGELVWSRWDKIRSNPNLFKAAGYASAATCAPGEDKYNGCVTRDFYGVSLLVSPKWLQVFPGADLSVPIFLSYGLRGNAATLSGGNEGADTYSVGLSLDYLNKYTFDLKYSDFLVNFRDNGSTVTTSNGALYRDRGLLAFTFKTSF
jgi:hypothetical protein